MRSFFISSRRIKIEVLQYARLTPIVLIMKIVIFIILLPILAAGLSHAQELKLNSIFQDGMVLQQQSEATIWGTSKPHETITLSGSWKFRRNTTKADSNGHWKTTIKTPKAGGPYRLTISSSTKILTVKDVLIGEVWICVGDGNMQWRMRSFGVDYWAEDVAKANFPQIRYCHIPQNLSLIPQENATCNWSTCSPNNVLAYGAVPYFFGSKLHQELNVPIGLIATNWSGSSAQSWMSRGFLGKKFPGYQGAFNKQDTLVEKLPTLFTKRTQGLSQQTPNLTYNAMLHPVIPFTIKGALYYQGRVNVPDPEQYQRLFPALIQNWREEWSLGDFPFYYVQIAPYHYNAAFTPPFFREAQTMALSEPNTGMVVTMDIGDPKKLNPFRKKPVGERLANLALVNDYGKTGLTPNSPLLNEFKIIGSSIQLTFHNAETGLASRDEKPLTHFTIAGSDRKFYPATATIKEQQLIVSSPKVSSPIAVRFAWGNSDEPNLMNKAGLPAPSFRTDTWPRPK